MRKGLISLVLAVVAVAGVYFGFDKATVLKVLHSTGFTEAAQMVEAASKMLPVQETEARNRHKGKENTDFSTPSQNGTTAAGDVSYPDVDPQHPGNRVNDSFQHVKKILLSQVYYDHAETLYCGYPFNSKTKEIDLPRGFSAPVHQERSARVEWEHVVPAEHFGQSFKEWKQGSGRCINKNGTHYKGRRCADEVSFEYRLMQADMYNLFPAVGSVNAVRSNYPYAILDRTPATFGTCEMKVADGSAEPPERARGRIARAMLYMAATYPTHYAMNDRTRKMINSWNERYPATEWECIRAARIERIQKNPNPFVIDACRRAGLPYREQ